jgi:mannose-1-phosphate guanylyltransferase
MLQDTCDRVCSLTPYERVFVVTGSDYAQTVRDQLAELPPGNVIEEPAGRGTAPAIGLGALYMDRLDPEAIMISLHADHVIRRVEEFLKALEAAAQVAEEGYLVTLGIQPDRLEVGYGYVERGPQLMEAGGHPAFKVERFTEKPNAETARAFVGSGRFYWNSGIFVWKVSRILEEIGEWLPALYGQLDEIRASLGGEGERQVLERIWTSVRSESIDVGVLERSQRVAVIPIDIGWNDVGSWATLLDLLPSDERGNVVIGQHQGLDTRRTLIHSRNRLVVTLGVEDLIIVDADDVLLVCPKDRAQDAKTVVEGLRSEGKSEYL